MAGIVLILVRCYEPMKQSGDYQAGKGALDPLRQEAMDLAGFGLMRCRPDGTVITMDEACRRILDLEDCFPDLSRLNGIPLSRLLVPLRSCDPLPFDIPAGSTFCRSIYPIFTVQGNAKWIMQDSYRIQNSQNGEEVIQIVLLALYPPSIQLPRGGGRFRSSLPAGGTKENRFVDIDHAMQME